jgi:hypothetical protein
MGYEVYGPIDKDLRPSMDLWALIKTNKTEINDSSKYLTSNYLTKNGQLFTCQIRSEMCNRKICLDFDYDWVVKKISPITITITICCKLCLTDWL